MTAQRLRALGLISFFALLGAGCSTVGEKQFACPGRPPGVRCMSASEVYAATETTDVVAATASHALGNDPQAGPGKSPKRTRDTHLTPKDPGLRQEERAPSSVSSKDPRLIAAATRFPAVEKPIPIRTPAQVMRVWIAPWEDAQGVLHGGGYHFIEVESRRWTLGERSMSNEPVRFFSIQKPNMESKESGGKDRSAPAVRTGMKERPTKSASTPSSNSGVSQ